MAKLKPVDAVGKIVTVLETLDSEDRARVIQAALTLIGDGDAVPEGLGAQPRSIVPFSARNKAGEKAYFDSKNPRVKTEELATAARFLEESENATSCTRADIERVIKAARRNFDARNFRRDLENARKANLFTRGSGKDSIVLSAHGQNYVDVLPNRDALKELDQPRRTRRVRNRTTKAAVRKSTK
jgi:hypothetical protein